MRWVRLLRRLYVLVSKLWQLPAWAYGGIYLLLIPGFACLYYRMPLDFYQTTARYEIPFRDDVKGLLEFFKHELVSAFNMRFGGPTASCGGATVDLSNIWVGMLEPATDHIAFRILAEARNPEIQHHILEFSVVMPVRSELAIFGDRYREPMMFNVTLIESGSRREVTVSQLGRCIEGK